jgi:YD repeat-containing protein
MDTRGVSARVAWAVSVLITGPLALSAEEKASHQISPFMGSLQYSIPIEVPPYHGLEPRLAVSYTSEGRNGPLGVGWSLSGVSTIERANPGGGTPYFGTYFPDIFLFDGQELIPCEAGSVSPSCTKGGTHSTKNESYTRIKRDSPQNVWHFWPRGGTYRNYSPILDVPAGIYSPGGTLRWGHRWSMDHDGNLVGYNWSCPDGDCRLDSIAYNGFEVVFYREPRPDEQSFSAATYIATQDERLRSILVRLEGGAPIRAYKLSYTTSPVTGRSLLSSVQQFGRDVSIDASGAITGGTSLPAQTFAYQDDALGQTFQQALPEPPSPPATTETVVWYNTTNVNATGHKIVKTSGAQWQAGGNSTRAITAGDGYVEWTASQTPSNAVIGLSHGDSSPLPSDIDFGIYQYYTGHFLLVVESGVYTYYQSQSLTPGDVLRVEVQGGVVYYKKNGATFHTTSSKPINYPLRVDASLRFNGSRVDDATIAGTLQHVGPACGDHNLMLSGDFNGDGLTDRLCTNGTDQKVSLATPSGFAEPEIWSTTMQLVDPILADFNADGLTDIARRIQWEGDFHVALSTGSGFTAFEMWGNANGYYNGFHYGCRIDPAFVGAGDFDGDGRQDVYCQLVTDGPIHIGRSTGSSFSFTIFADTGCPAYNERVGTIDFDGNGMSDYFCVGDQGNLKVFPSTGSKFQGHAFGALPSFCGAASYVFGDFNADARTDVACLATGGVALSTGRSLIVQGTYGAVCTGPQPNGFAVDLDGDSASEIVCNQTGTPENDIEVRKWVNGALAPAETWLGNWCSGKVSSGDFDGDGKPDLYCDSNPEAVAFSGSKGIMADLITGIENGIGGTTTVSYTPSSAFDNTNNPPIKYAVTAATVEDGRGGTATTTYEFADGFIDRAERRFLGFGYVRQTLPCITGEASCPYTETWLRQDKASAGKPERIVRSDGAGNALTIADYEHTTNAPDLPRTSHLTGQWMTTLDGSGATCSSWPCAAGVRTYVTHDYDDLGNVTQTVSYGDYDQAGDETTTVYAYSMNNGKFITRLGRTAVHAGVGTGGQKLSETLTRYDGASSWTQPPTVGHPTEVLTWLDTEDRYVSSATAYDATGMPVSWTDPTGGTTTVEYDLTYNMFPVATTDPVGQTTETDWDPVCGVPVSTFDLNGLETTHASDALCRPVETVFPNGGFERQ